MIRTMPPRRVALLSFLLLARSADSFSASPVAPPPPNEQLMATPPAAEAEGRSGNLEAISTTTAVRFSLFPKVHRDVTIDPSSIDPPSVREVVRSSLRGLDELGCGGVEVLPDAGVMSTTILGPEMALFEAVRVAFGRASRVGARGLPRQVSMACTFSSEHLPVPPHQSSSSSSAAPPLTPGSVPTLEGGWEFATTHEEECFLAEEAYLLPSRVACHLSVYPMGTTAVDHRRIKHSVTEHVRRHHASVYQSAEVGPFCTALEGGGADVFDAVRSCFALARELSGGRGDVVVTATLTGNKRQWTNDFFERTCND